MIRHLPAALLLAAITLLSGAASARDLGTPTGPVLLTVTQAGGETWEFDRAMIEALGWQTITTVTPFTEGPQEFSGVPLGALVEATGVTGTVIDAVASTTMRPKSRPNMSARIPSFSPSITTGNRCGCATRARSGSSTPAKRSPVPATASTA